MGDRLRLRWTYRKALRLRAKRDKALRRAERDRCYAEWAAWYDDNRPSRPLSERDS